MQGTTKVTGTIDTIGEISTFGKNDFRKRELWLCLDKDAERPQFICLEVIYELVDSLSDDFSVGDPVVAHYSLGGRKWMGPSGERCFNALTLKTLQSLTDRDEFDSESASEDNNEMPF